MLRDCKDINMSSFNSFSISMHLMSRTTEASGLTHGPEMKLLLGSMNGDGAPKKFWNRCVHMSIMNACYK